MANILLIEDEQIVAETLEIVLFKAGHDVVVAANGDIGLAQFIERKPDLVITDIIMPEKEGLETIRAIREKDPSVPILAYSGGGRTRNFDFLRMADKLGANEVLRKPFTNEDMIAAVARLTSKS